MPAYNVAPYVEAAIASVLAQQGVTFELLIGDDGSTDGTWDVIQRYRHDPRVRAWRFRQHRGFGGVPVRNTLAARARGRYLSICDADDVMLPGNLRRLSQVLDGSPSIGMVCPQRRYLDRRGRRLPRRHRFPDPRQQWDLLKTSATHGGSMIRRTLLRRLDGYRAAMHAADAHDLFLRAAEVSRIALVRGRPYYAYRRRRRPEGYRRWLADLERQAVRDAIRRRYGYRVPW